MEDIFNLLQKNMIGNLSYFQLNVSTMRNIMKIYQQMSKNFNIKINIIGNLMHRSLFYYPPEVKHKFSIQQINNRVSRQSIDKQYSQLIHKKYQRQEKERRETQEYIRYLEDQNLKLHTQIEHQKEKHKNQVDLLKERIQVKDSLLQQCQKQIGKIRKQYEIIDKVVLKDQSMNIQKAPVHKHGLIKQKKYK